MIARPARRRDFVQLALAGTALAACISPPSVRAETVLRLSLGVGPTDPLSVMSTRFASLIQQRSGGALRIEIFNSGTLAKERESIDGLRTGTVDMTLQTSALLATLSPQVQIFDMPFLFDSRAGAQRIIDGDIGRNLTADLAQEGIVVLSWGNSAWRNFELIPHPVTHPDDMRGMRMRIQNGAVFVSMFRALGAIPVAIDASEYVVALQQKTIDGMESPLTAVYSFKTYTFLKFVSLTQHLYNAAALMIGKGRFDSLPADQKRLFVETGREITPYWRALLIQYENDAIAKLKAAGLVFNQIDNAAFKHAMTPVYEEFRGKIGPKIFDQAMNEAAR